VADVDAAEYRDAQRPESVSQRAGPDELRQLPVHLPQSDGALRFEKEDRAVQAGQPGTDESGNGAEVAADEVPCGGTRDVDGRRESFGLAMKRGGFALEQQSPRRVGGAGAGQESVDLGDAAVSPQCEVQVGDVAEPDQWIP